MNTIITLIKKLPSGTANAIVDGARIFIRPFWFSHKKKYLIVPYFYVSVAMMLFFASVTLYLYLAYQAAMHGIQDAGVVLGTVNLTIGTLMGIVGIMIKLYNDGNDGKSDDNNDND